ncbi:hypothetical protein [Allonocardiopsis opalescens]|uniref:Uncharacterized protein n=1 Tax=Allonocardiopsis opalescens TaxID=1144618 RepID=A0A2T0QAU2_9ACTN|nr:hypothetical protein [Allonocardiopsis opalescens]PRY00935.1 hypothetical protein CLV72_102568 [Allonocardiopsis opalescens]
MLKLMRSPRLLMVIVGIVCLGLVVPAISGLIGFAPSAQPPDAAASAPPPQPAPPAAEMGEPPQDIRYDDYGEQCSDICIRVIGLSAEDATVDEQLDRVRERLHDEGYDVTVQNEETGEFLATREAVVVAGGPTDLENPEEAATLLMTWGAPA